VFLIRNTSSTGIRLPRVSNEDQTKAGGVASIIESSLTQWRDPRQRIAVPRPRKRARPRKGL